MKYLNIEPKYPKVAVFDFTSCEGCQLQLANKEETLVPFLQAIDIVNFREISSTRDADYEVALVEGSISREDEVERLKSIRKQAKILVALGSCACFGGVHKLKNSCDLAAANAEVYGDKPKDTLPVRPLKEIVAVDLEISGCPVSKAEVELVVRHLVLGSPFQFPAYSVCLECKQRFTVCMFQKGQLCLGFLAKAGCNAPCPAGGTPCWGCRGPMEEANYEEFFEIAKEHKFSREEVVERMSFFGGFDGVLK